MTDDNASYEADELVREGIRMVAAGSRDEGIARIEKGLSLAPDHPFGRLHLGLALAGEDRMEEAEPHLRRALELRPDSPAFHIFAGRAFFDAREHKSAARAFHRALELNGENDLARGYALLNEWAAGNADASRHLHPDALPDSNVFLARLLMLIELEMKGRSADYVREDPAVPLLDRPRIAFELWRSALEQKKGLFDQAAMRAHVVMEMQPGHPGAVALQQECRRASLEASRRRVEEDSDNAELRLDLAFHLADEELFAEAAEQVEEAARLIGEGKEGSPLESPQALRLRGRIAYGQGNVDEALRLIEAGAEPGFTMLETNYCVGLCRLAQGRRLECVRAFEALVARFCWGVPQRFREFLAWRRDRPGPGSACGTQTSPSGTAESPGAP